MEIDGKASGGTTAEIVNGLGIKGYGPAKHALETPSADMVPRKAVAAHTKSTLER
jgi:hypothetical protein